MKPREFWRNYLENGDYEDLKVPLAKGERVFSNIHPELEGKAHTHVKEAVLFRKVVPIDWNKVWSDPSITSNLAESMARIELLVEKQLAGEE